MRRLPLLLVGLVALCSCSYHLSGRRDVPSMHVSLCPPSGWVYRWDAGKLVFEPVDWSDLRGPKPHILVIRMDTEDELTSAMRKDLKDQLRKSPNFTKIRTGAYVKGREEVEGFHIWEYDGPQGIRMRVYRRYYYWQPGIIIVEIRGSKGFWNRNATMLAEFISRIQFMEEE